MTERRIYQAERSLVDFFLANPGEELTADDAAAKLGITVPYAAKLLSSLTGLGVLGRVSVYRLVPRPAPESQTDRANGAPALCTPVGVKGRTQASAPGDPIDLREQHPA